MKKLLTPLELKEKQLNGKRYKIINESINKAKKVGKYFTYEDEIELHYAWMLTFKRIKNEKVME